MRRTAVDRLACRYGVPLRILIGSRRRQGPSKKRRLDMNDFRTCPLRSPATRSYQITNGERQHEHLQCAVEQNRKNRGRNRDLAPPDREYIDSDAERWDGCAHRLGRQSHDQPDPGAGGPVLARLPATCRVESGDSTVDRLANGYFSRHPIQGMVVLLLAFGLAGGIAPLI